MNIDIVICGLVVASGVICAVVGLAEPQEVRAAIRHILGLDK